MSASSSAVLPSRSGAPALLREATTQLPLVGGFLLLLLVAAASVWLIVGNHRFNASVAHTLQVRSEGYRLLTLVQDAETGQRGYLLTGDPDYLAPYTLGTAQAPRALRELEALSAHNVPQMAILARLRPEIAAKLAELARTITLQEGGDHAGALAVVRDNSGNGYMRQIREDIAGLEAREEETQAAESAAAEANTRLLAGASLASLAIVLALAAYVVAFFRRATTRLIGAQDALRHTNENLEAIVAERVAELQVANDEIQRFAYIVSHDLRAPLVNVMGFTSELEAVQADVGGVPGGGGGAGAPARHAGPPRGHPDGLAGGARLHPHLDRRRWTASSTPS